MNLSTLPKERFVADAETTAKARHMLRRGKSKDYVSNYLGMIPEQVAEIGASLPVRGRGRPPKIVEDQPMIPVTNYRPVCSFSAPGYSLTRMQPVAGIPAPRHPSASAIQAIVAEHFLIPVAEMKSQRRGADIARPRQVAMYLCRKLTPISMPEIGRRFGNRDHSTVIHAIKRIEALCEADPDFAAEVLACSKKIVP